MTEKTHPPVTLFNFCLLDIPKFGRYETTFSTSTVNLARKLADKQYLELRGEDNNESFVRCAAGALRGIITVLAGNSTTVSLPHDALLLVEVWDELKHSTTLLPVRELQDGSWTFNNGRVFVEARPDNHWYFCAAEVLNGPVPNPEAPAFRVTIHVLQDNSEARFIDQMKGVGRSAAQHVSIMLPEANKAVFEHDYLADVHQQMDALLALCRSGRQTAAEQTVRQTVLACATRYAKI